jgi:ABC-2 type transport system permease protein
MNLNGFLQLVQTQATMIRRNTGFWLSSIIMAVLSMAVFGWLFSPDSTSAFDLAIVDEDRSETSQTLAASFEGLDNVEVKTGDRDDEMKALDHGDRGAVLIVPAGFGEGVASGDASVQAFFDNSNPIRIGYVRTTVDSVIGAFNEEVVGSVDAVKIEQREVSTDNVRFIDFLTPGMVGMTIMWVNLGVGFMIVTWREQGILRRLGVTPLGPGRLIASQAVSFSLVSIMQVLVIMGMGRLVFDVNVSGSYLLLALVVFTGVLAMLAIGYVLASLLKTVTSVNAALNMVSFPMIFLGGSYFPLDTPTALAPVVETLPLTHLNDALREVVNHGGGLNDIWVNLAVLVGWVAGGFLVSVRLFRWQ